jgi:2-C-methyl-D-erythritol 2,4-cyclodiphosphate synthase
MRESIAGILGVGLDAVSIKATTTDHLGFAGRGEGICAMAVALIEMTGRKESGT